MIKLKKVLKQNIFIIYILSIGINANAQSITFEKAKKQYPDELAIYVKKSEQMNIDIVKDSVIVTTENFSDMLHLSEKSNVYAERSVPHSKFMELIEIKANTLSPTKNEKFENVKVTNFTVQNDISSGVFYDDGKSTNFIFPSIKEGAHTIYQYKHKIREPRFLTSYFFAEHASVLESEFKVVVNSKIKVKFELFGITKEQLEYSEEIKGKQKIYTWKAKNLKGYRFESSCPNIRYFAPHIMAYVEEVELKNTKKQYLSEPQQLYDFFYSFVKDVNKNEDEQIKKVVDSLTTGVKSDLEKTKRIFYWVQDHIRYIAFEDGYGGFIPREASAIYQKRYGDCKDMASIITYMLHQAKIPAYLTWIGARNIPYTFDKNPSPNAANHMIATAFVDGKYIYLDATGTYTRFGFPTEMIQGKQCIIAKNERTFDKQFVPIMDKTQSGSVDSVNISISGKTIKGAGIKKVDGYSKLNLVPYLIGKSEEKQKEILTGYLEKGNNKFFLESFNLKDVEDRDKKISIDYQFKVEDYAKSINNEIYINMNLDKIFHNDDIDTTKRKLPIEYDFKFINQSKVILEIPAGYKVGYIPSNQHFKGNKFEFKIEYNLVKNKISMKRVVLFDELMLEKEQFKSWNEMIAELNKAYKEVVVLKK
ncbi:MAG: hypothetical protein RLZZ175_469 [Bacteroidota bacterium]|jgi:transglutaminase-like putative cysteine protease